MYYAWCRWFVPWAHNHLNKPWGHTLNSIFPLSNQGLGIENEILDTFDAYSPTFHGIHTPEEVEGWFQEAGLVDIHRPSDWATCVRGVKGK